MGAAKMLSSIVVGHGKKFEKQIVATLQTPLLTMYGHTLRVQDVSKAVGYITLSEDDTIVACLIFWKQQSRNTVTFETGMEGVLPTHCRMGLGTRLFDELKRHALETEKTRQITLQASVDANAAYTEWQTLWMEKMGFVKQADGTLVCSLSPGSL